MTDKFLDDVYKLSTPEATREHFRKWAASYDSEVGSNGYVTPTRVADALWSKLPQPTKPILDYGCGTGLSGEALRAAGFQVIDGMDPTQEMLDGAATKGIYRDLILFDLENKTPVKQGAYDVIAAVGVIGAGAAPPEVFDMLMHALPKSGILAFSFNDHTLKDHSYTTRLNDWLDMGAARLLFREYGPHLPGAGLNSDVYIVEKA